MVTLHSVKVKTSEFGVGDEGSISTRSVEEKNMITLFSIFRLIFAGIKFCGFRGFISRGFIFVEIHIQNFRKDKISLISRPFLSRN